MIVYEQRNEVVLTESHGHVDDFERLYEYGFESQVSCTVKDLFKNYEFSDDVYKHAKKSRSRCYSFAGSRAQGRFDAAVNKVAKMFIRKISICQATYRRFRGK